MELGACIGAARTCSRTRRPVPPPTYPESNARRYMGGRLDQFPSVSSTEASSCHRRERVATLAQATALVPPGGSSTQTGDTCPVWWTKKLCQLSVPGYEMPDIAGGAGFSMFPFLMRQDISPLAPHRPTLQFDYRAAQRGEPRGPVHWLARHAHVDVVQIVPGVNLARLLIHIGTHRWWHTGHYVHRLLDQ